ncbi:MAG: hypothetical protein K2Q14_01035, partial [Gammaproteobacteria bacterium]|nr:hypothetical protein [Gammaproteobacteria bacterium]
MNRSPDISNTINDKPRFGLWYFFKSYWANTPRARNILLVVLMAATGALQIFSLVAINDWQNIFFDALQAYETSKVAMLVLAFVVISLIISGGFALNNYFAGLFSLKWRIHLTKQIKQQWLSHSHYDRLQQQANIDNPEQRISDDLNLLPQLTIIIANQVFQSVITLGAFSFQLWTLSKQWDIKLNGQMVHFPGIYLWATLFYSLFFNLVIFKFGHNLINLNYFNQKLTANFRYIMSLIREHSRKIVLQQFAPYHEEKTTADFSSIVKNSLAILRLDRLIAFVRQYCMNSAGMTIQLVALPAYFNNHLQIGYLMQTGGAAFYFINALAVLIL